MKKKASVQRKVNYGENSRIVWDEIEERQNLDQFNELFSGQTAHEVIWGTVQSTSVYAKPQQQRVGEVVYKKRLFSSPPD